jgi:uncharacterized protein
MATDVGWTAIQWPGVEHVIVSADADSWRADGRVILAEQRLASVDYQLRCDAGFCVRGLTINVTESGGEAGLVLVADGRGHWRANGQARPDLDGCVDLDINCTPLTNTLPIGRLDWSAGQAYDLDVVYVSVPDLGVRRVRQRYTLLDRGTGEELGQSVFRYESGSFRADLRVDSHGLVIDYPGIWQRIGAAGAGADVSGGSGAGVGSCASVSGGSCASVSGGAAA